MTTTLYNSRLLYSFLLTICVSVFIGVAYFIGRQYLEGYFQILGIPSTFFNFSTADYIYTSFTSITIFVALVVALFAYGFIKLLIIWDTGHNWSIWGIPKSTETLFTPIEISRKHYIVFKVIFWFYTVVYIFLLICLAFIRFGIPISFIRDSLQIIFVIPCIFYGYYLTQEPNIILMFSQINNKSPSRDKRSKTTIRKFCSILLLLSGIFVLWLVAPFPSIWGQTKGKNDWTNVSHNASNALSVIEVTTDKYNEYPSIKWVSISENISKNQDSLILILATDEELFVRNIKSKYNSAVTILQRQDIDAINVISSQ